jgi:hypothetical protein
MKVIFLKKMFKSAISNSRSKNKRKKLFFAILTIGSCPRLLGEHVQKFQIKSFKKVDCTDCEIITFEVERKVFFPCAR